MCAPRRNVFLGLAVLLMIMAGALAEFGPIVCVDGCADHGVSCGDCACCAPARAPVVLAQPDGEFVQTSSTHETQDPVRPSRSEERDVFHVPRHNA